MVGGRYFVKQYKIKKNRIAVSLSCLNDPGANAYILIDITYAQKLLKYLNIPIELLLYIYNTKDFYSRPGRKIIYRMLINFKI